MHKTPQIVQKAKTISSDLVDSFGREHTYLRISLIEKCNLRCTYCMPAEGVQLSPRNDIMTADEVIAIAAEFVRMGVTKIRLTGGEPLLRKDAAEIIDRLSAMPVELAITTNGVLLDRYFELFQQVGLNHINISLDTLKEHRFKELTRRNDFQKVRENIFQCFDWGIKPRINVVLLKGQNEDEIVDFVSLTKDYNLTVRFIEFMPFDGNQWNSEKLVSLSEVLQKVSAKFGRENLHRIEDAAHDTSKNYKIEGFKGQFSVISTVTNPFCDSCNRIRLTANGKIKNCLFSEDEADLLSTFRAGKKIGPEVQKALEAKKFKRGGMDTLEEFSNPTRNQHNRSMILIGG